MFGFVLQFAPDLLLVYLYAVYESNVKVSSQNFWFKACLLSLNFVQKLF